MKTFLTVLGACLVLILAVVAYAADPAWKDTPIIPGILTLQATNAEVGVLADFVSHRSYSVAATNLLRLGKALDLKIGVAGVDTASPILVAGAGETLVALIDSVNLLGGTIEIKSEALTNVSLNIMGGYDPQNQSWLAGLSCAKLFVIPNPL